jgi:hypothetical protein
VVVLVGVDDQRGAIRITQAVATVEQGARRDLGIGRSVTRDEQVGQVALIRAVGVEESVLRTAMVHMRLGRLILAGVGAIPDGMEMDAVPARWQAARLNRDPCDRPVVAAFEGERADLLALSVEDDCLHGRLQVRLRLRGRGGRRKLGLRRLGRRLSRGRYGYERRQTQECPCVRRLHRVSLHSTLQESGS